MFTDKNRVSLILMCARVYARRGVPLDELGKVMGVDGRQLWAYFQEVLPGAYPELDSGVNKALGRWLAYEEEIKKHWDGLPKWNVVSDTYLEYLFTKYNTKWVSFMFNVSYDAARSKKYRLKEKLKKTGHMFVKKEISKGYQFCSDCGSTIDSGETVYNVSTRYTACVMPLCRACTQSAADTINKFLNKKENT